MDVIVSVSCIVMDIVVCKFYSINLIDVIFIVVGIDIVDCWGFLILMGSGIFLVLVYVWIIDDDGISDLVGVGIEFIKVSSGDIVIKIFWYSF